MDKGISVTKTGKCVVLTMNRGENRFNFEFIEAMNRALDKVESYKDAIAMVTTAQGKYYSLGLDLEELITLSPPQLAEFSDQLQKLLARLLTFPMVTVAALNGHTYAGGAFLALVHDYKIMRTEKGWYCFSEVHIKRAFTAGFVELLKARFPQQAMHEAVVFGRKYTAEEAKEAKIIDEVCSMSKLISTAVEAAKRLAGKEGFDRKTISAIKHDFYRDAYIVLNEPVRFYSKL